MQAKYKDGRLSDPEPLHPERLKEYLNNPEIESVKVFNITEGDVVTLYNGEYKVTRKRPNGDLVLKLKKTRIASGVYPANPLLNAAKKEDPIKVPAEKEDEEHAGSNPSDV